MLGFVLLLLKDWWTRRRKHKAYWHALKAELEFARGLADTFLSDRVAAPLYRLPRDAFDSCYPELLADGAVSEAESHALMAYFNEVATMNRGLDRAADASDDATLKAEYERNRLKAERLSILLVEQNYHLALRIADRVYVMSKGQIVYEGTPAALESNEEVKHRYLGVA